MGKAKKFVAIVAALAVAAGASYGGITYMRKQNQQSVYVVSVDSLAEEFYSDDVSLEGTITTNVSQKIRIDKDTVVKDVFVTKGQEVHTGEMLASFDTTLVEMELNIARLKKQKQESDLNLAMDRLTKLQNGGSVTEDDLESTMTFDSESSGDDEAYAGSSDGTMLGAATRVMLLAADLLSDGDVEETPAEESPAAQEPEEPAEVPQEPGPDDGTDGEDAKPGEDEGDFSDEEMLDSGDDEEIPGEEPGDEDGLGDDDELSGEPGEDELTGGDELTDGVDTFYTELDYKSLPIAGSGTEEDPFVFLVSSEPDYIVIKGSFLNKMAGLTEDGGMVLHEGGYWYQLEKHEGDQVADYNDRKLSCTGYILRNGGEIDPENPDNNPPFNTFEDFFVLPEDYQQYETEEDMGEPAFYDGGDAGEDLGISRKEAIKIQKTRIANLKLDLQESDLNIAKLERKVNMKEVYCRLDGTVSYVGDAVTGSSSEDAFIKVKSKDGFFVKGSVSELMLEQMQPGAALNCTSWESGNFAATVIDVSEYPVSGDSFWSTGNPNVSYYSYTASIDDEELTFTDQDWVQVNLKERVVNDDMIISSKAFVTSESGMSFVLKEGKDHKLVKQPVKSGGVTNGGYSVIILGGLKRTDRIAFPYGKYAVEGTLAKEGTIDSLYQ